MMTRERELLQQALDALDRAMELIDPRNHGTRVSWMQGHDKACDISNDAAAHGIAASPEQPK